MNLEYSFEELCPYIRDIGLQQRDSWKYMQRKIYDHLFFFCFMGTANIIIDGKYYKIKAGDLILVPPNTSHSFWINDEDVGELFWCHFDFFNYPDKEFIYNVYNTANLYIKLFEENIPYAEHIRDNPVFKNNWRFPTFISIKAKDRMHYLFETIYKDFMYASKYKYLNAKIYFLEILQIIIEESFCDESSVSDYSYIVNQIKSYIAANYYKKISVKEICDVTGLNCEYASKIFKNQTGIKLIEYLNAYRIDKAKNSFLALSIL